MQIVVTAPGSYHSGMNLGFNFATAVNFAFDQWEPEGRKFETCTCQRSVHLIFRSNPFKSIKFQKSILFSDLKIFFYAMWTKSYGQMNRCHLRKEFHRHWNASNARKCSEQSHLWIFTRKMLTLIKCSYVKYAKIIDILSFRKTLPFIWTTLMAKQ